MLHPSIFFETVRIFNQNPDSVVSHFQVIDWLDNHGDVFLNKNTAIGKSLQRTKTLQKSHEHFESVAQVSATHIQG